MKLRELIKKIVSKALDVTNLCIKSDVGRQLAHIPIFANDEVQAAAALWDRMKLLGKGKELAPNKSSSSLRGLRGAASLGWQVPAL